MQFSQSEDKNLCTSYIIKTNTWLKSLQSWYKMLYLLATDLRQEKLKF